ncbi:MAG: hypothetical protein GY953_20445, partial [bacterium]|nr:hypothetical protein [bacterium]
VGLRENYYAWGWGDALFVVLDPYWYTTTNPKESKGLWDRTIGNDQYRWLKRTLETSEARFKFVFAHHVLGETRGGIEWADRFEWGGRNNQGRWEFDTKRPGWELPIHPLMAANGVTIFFQGHDHVFVKQELDGVIYQECPMPADPTFSKCLETGDCYGPGRPAEYRFGDILQNSGHVRVTVTEAKVVVDYIRAWRQQDEGDGRVNGQIAYSYTVGASHRELRTVSAASFTAAAAAGSIVSAFGSELDGDIAVTVRDRLGTERQAEVLFASPSQVNFVTPPGTAIGIAGVTITRAGTDIAVGNLVVEPVAPAIFTANSDGAGVAAAVIERVDGEGNRTTQLTFECGQGPGQCRPLPIDTGSATLYLS